MSSSYKYTPYTYKKPITPADDFVGVNFYANPEFFWGVTQKPSQTGGMNYGQRWNNDNPIMDKITPIQPKKVKSYLERIASEPASQRLHVNETQSTKLLF
jgi:hypothetical protein